MTKKGSYTRTKRETIFRTACTVMAAGLSSRFGSLKQLARLDDKGKPLIQIALDIANRSESDYVYIVLGNKSEEVMKKLELGRAQIILNKEYRKGLSTSITASISNLSQDCKALVLMVADQPFLTSGLINRLIDTLWENENIRIASLAYHGEPRNPAIFRSDLFDELAGLNGDRGAKDIVMAHRFDVTLINVNDERVFLDIDTLSSLRSMSKEKERKTKSKS